MATGAKYKKNPVEVDAIQYMGSQDLKDIERWVQSFGDDFYFLFRVGSGNIFGVRTLEDEKYNFHTIRLNDFIVRGIDGEYYPCFPAIFIKLHTKI